MASRPPRPRTAPNASNATATRHSSSASESSNPNSRPPSPLSPPRPFFLAAGGHRDSSGSLLSDSSLEPGSASDSEREQPASQAQPGTSGAPVVGSRRGAAAVRARNHQRRRSGGVVSSSPVPGASQGSYTINNGAQYAPVDVDTPSPTSADPFRTPAAGPQQPEGWSPASLYRDFSPTNPPSIQGSLRERPPPSSYPFPFQSHMGNPDPGMTIPGVSRRGSLDSMRARSVTMPPAIGGPAPLVAPPVATSSDHGHQTQGLTTRASSIGDMSSEGHGGQYGHPLPRPYAPFMVQSGGGSPRASFTAGSDYRMSMGGPPAGYYNQSQPQLYGPDGMPVGGNGGIPRSASTTFRTPFLSPASRPSSIWTPPTYPYMPSADGASTAAISVPKSKPPLPSTRLPEKLSKEDKPWLKEKDTLGRLSWWLTFFGMVLGLGGAAVLCWQGYTGVQVLKDSQLCLVLEDDFNSLDTQNTWNYDVELGGFGNGEFQMTTDSSTNIYTQNGELYIVPTLTSDEIGTGAIFDGGTYTLQDCTSQNQSACTTSSSAATGQVINPVKSARINTQGKYNIAYGKVEVRAKLPTGDWLWPAIWMLPEDNNYGPWPLSGEIDIMEARGNGPSYSAQGNNFVRSSLNYGPMDSLINMIFGWQSTKRTTFAADFHIYSMEWTGTFMRFYIDNRLHSMLDLKLYGKGGKNMWDRGSFPPTAQNGSTQVVVSNPWSSGSAAAPFDQSFYLILDVAAGGTSGWFPDKVGNKPWYDGSATAMHDFASAQSTWYSTWPQNIDDRAFRVDYVKMWKLC